MGNWDSFAGDMLMELVGGIAGVCMALFIILKLIEILSYVVIYAGIPVLVIVIARMIYKHVVKKEEKESEDMEKTINAQEAE